MVRQPKRFHGLKKVKFRASWNKFNLFNLSRLRIPKVDFQTYFQQKWTAKSISRAFHGEHLLERQWHKLFNPKLEAVVPMDHRYLAENDGSEQAAGRGSGLDMKPAKGSERERKGNKQTPYMHQLYAPIERRLDMAVWRSLFASSARQARQMVTHGQVKVNGKKMPYAGYLLNPGDMFQVEPERVLYATGTPKEKVQVKAGREKKKLARNKNTRKQDTTLNRKQKQAAKEATRSDDAPSKVREPARLDASEFRRQRKIDLQTVLKLAEGLRINRRHPLRAKQKATLRALIRSIKYSLSRANRDDTKLLDAALRGHVKALKLFGVDVHKMAADQIREEISHASTAEGDEESLSSRSQGQWTSGENNLENAKTGESNVIDGSRQTHSQKARRSRPWKGVMLRDAILRARENPIDETKPYATPWLPRPYMSAFAFIPRYLEVNHNICSAVYLRHPAARPGSSEMPSPFPDQTQQLAFNWYLRGR